MAITGINNVNNVKFNGYRVVEMPYNRYAEYDYEDIYPQEYFVENRRDLEETRRIFDDISQTSKVKPLKRLGQIADVLITGALSGMALHWSTGKTVVLLNKLSKKPKVANFLKKVAAPFKTLYSASKNGLKMFGKTIKKDVNKSKNGKKFLNNKYVVYVKDRISDAVNGIKKFNKKVKGLSLEKVRNGVAAVFGISGFIAGAVDRIDAYKGQ